MNDQAHEVNADHLRQLVKRIEAHNERIDDETEALRQIYVEAQNSGYCTKTIRKIVCLRNWRADEFAEEEAIEKIYRSALGML